MTSTTSLIEFMLEANFKEWTKILLDFINKKETKINNKHPNIIPIFSKTICIIKIARLIDETIIKNNDNLNESVSIFENTLSSHV